MEVSITSSSILIEGDVVVMLEGVVSDATYYTPSLLDHVPYWFVPQEVSVQLVSATVGDPNYGEVVGEPAYLEEIMPSVRKIVVGEFVYRVKFVWDESQGIPGAIIVKNFNKDNKFLLKGLTIENFPGKGRIHFDCNSWVYCVDKYSYNRVFFANDTYLPWETPAPLRLMRQEELIHLRGDGEYREMKEWDRIYNYALYNDLGTPDSLPPHPRPILGGSKAHPYPRRGFTGRPPTKNDPNCESRPLHGDFYVPRDERFGHIKQSDFRDQIIDALCKALRPEPLIFYPDNPTPNEFDSFDDILKLFGGGLSVPSAFFSDDAMKNVPFKLLRDTIGSDEKGHRIIKFYSMPQVIQADVLAWQTDEEFAREMVAGVNPVIISRLQEFPPTSSLDPGKYGNQNSSITEAHIENKLDGLTVEQALRGNKLFILNHHDSMMPFVNLINSTTTSKIYATRTLLFLKDDGALKPLAIELSLPHPDGEQFGAVSKVFTPSDHGVEGAIWQLARAYVGVNDSGVHQLISHWLLTHASIEPFILATNRQMSVMHPINKLLKPHYLDNMNINALARKQLISAGGIVELTFFPVQHSMEMSSAVYKSWNFVEQALPADLLKRGIAVKDPTDPNKLQLLIKDYPYAVDGLKIWSAIETLVTDYCSIYYPSDRSVRADTELQSWWTEVREVGHGDHKDKPWWPKMKSVHDLIQCCSIIIWVSSALHAAVNFGQYPYAGYLPNRPTLSRKLMPEPGSSDYDRLSTDPEKVLLETITTKAQCIIEMSLIEILSTHSTDEVYLGERNGEWTKDQRALGAFHRFRARLKEIQREITKMNGDPTLLNRNGPVKMPYNLLFPTSEPGLTAMGIPNSISI